MTSSRGFHLVINISWLYYISVCDGGLGGVDALGGESARPCDGMLTSAADARCCTPRADVGRDMVRADVGRGEPRGGVAVPVFSTLVFARFGYRPEARHLKRDTPLVWN